MTTNKFACLLVGLVGSVGGKYLIPPRYRIS